MKAARKTRYSLRKLFETRKRNISADVDSCRRKPKVMARAVKTEGVKSGVRRMRGRPRTKDTKNRNSRKMVAPTDTSSQRTTPHAVAREGSLSPAQREPPQLELMPAVEEDSDISLMFPSFISIDDHLSPGKCILLCPSTSCRKRFSNPIELVSHIRNLHRTSNNFESSLSQKDEKNSLVVYACPICRHTQFSTHTTSSDLIMLSEHADRYHGKSLLPSDFSYFCSVLFDPVNKEVSASERLPTIKEPDVFYVPCRSERNYSPILPLLPHSSTNYLEPTLSYEESTSQPESSSRLSPRTNILFRNLKAPTDACASTIANQAGRTPVVTHNMSLITTPVSPVAYSPSLRESPAGRTSAAVSVSVLKPLATSPATVTAKAPNIAFARSPVRPLLTMPPTETNTVFNANIPVLALASSAQISSSCPLYVPASPAKAHTLLSPPTPISSVPPSASSFSTTITTANSFVGDSKRALLRNQVPVLTPQKPDPHPSTSVDAAIATFHQLIQSTYPPANTASSVGGGGGGSRAQTRSPYTMATSPSPAGHSQMSVSKRTHPERDQPPRQLSTVTVSRVSEATAVSTPVLTGLSFLQPVGLTADSPCSLVEQPTSGTPTGPKMAKLEATPSSTDVNGIYQPAVPSTANAQHSTARQSVNGSSLENALTCSAASMVDWESDCQLSPTSATYGLYTLATLSVRQAAEFAEKSAQKKSSAQESVVSTTSTFTSDWTDSTSARLFEGSNIVGVERIPLSISPNAPVDQTPKQQGPSVLPVVRGRNRRLLPRKFNKCAVIEPSSSQSSVSVPEAVVTTSPASNSIVCLTRGPLKSAPVGILTKLTSVNHNADSSCSPSLPSETFGRKRCLPPLAVKPPREATTNVLQRPTLITIRPAATSEAASSSSVKVVEISPLSISPGGLQSPRILSTSSRMATARDSDTPELSKVSFPASSHAPAASTVTQSTASSEPDRRVSVVNPLISIMCESGDHAAVTSSLVVTQTAPVPSISAYAATPILFEPLQSTLPPTALDSIRTCNAPSEPSTTTGLEHTSSTDSLTPNKPTAAPTILPISLSHNGLPFMTPNRLSGVPESTVTVTSVPIRPALQSTVKVDDKAVPLMTAILANVPLHPPARAKLLTSNAYVTVQPRPPTYRSTPTRSTHLQKILPRPQQLPPVSLKEASSSRADNSGSWPTSQAGESTSLPTSIKVSILSPSLPVTSVVSTYSQQLRVSDLPPPSPVVATTTQAVNGSSVSAASTPPPTTSSPRDRTQLSPKLPTYLLLRSTPVTDVKSESNQPDTLAGSSV
uniref:C2H2-type zinc finger n=1 Tax=Schistocephalus solidus TaxID=70667 RepID=A0A0X3P6A7_SCHSO